MFAWFREACFLFKGLVRRLQLRFKGLQKRVIRVLGFRI